MSLLFRLYGEFRLVFKSKELPIAGSWTPDLIAAGALTAF